MWLIVTLSSVVSASATPVMVTACATAQFPAVKVSDDGFTVAVAVDELATATVTSPPTGSVSSRSV